MLLVATRSDDEGEEAQLPSNSRQSNNVGLSRRSMLSGSAHRGILQFGVDSVGVVVVDVFTE